MLKQINSYNEYKDIVAQFADYHLSQSALFYRAREFTKTVFKSFAYYKGEEIVAFSQVLEKTVLRNKKMLLLPFGPVVKANFTSTDLRGFLAAIIEDYNDPDIVFVQADLFSMNPLENERLQSILIDHTKLTKSFSTYRHSDGTTVISLAQSPQEQFTNYRKDVKANIKKAEKNAELEIKINRDPAEFEKFWLLYEATQKKKHFKDMRKGLYSQFYQEDSAFLIEAYAAGEVVASVYCLEYKEQNTLITFLSSTTVEGNRLKAPTFLRWKILNYAYEQKYKQVDLFSMDKGFDGHSGFKMGFRGEIIWFNNPVDFVVQPFSYNLLKIVDKLR